MQKGNEKLYNISFYINCKANSLEELNLVSKKIESQLNGIMMIPKVPMFRMSQGLKSSIPLSINELNIKRNITTKALSAFFPFTSQFLNIDENGVLFGMNKNDVPIIRDIFTLTNPNGLTGGKAVLHEHELTYSIILDENLLPKSIVESYKIISQGILIAPEMLGLKARMKEFLDEKPKSAICFNEPSYYEIIVNGKKIVGSAQTRKKKKILQHGAVLIEIDVDKYCSLFNNYSEKSVEETRKRVTSLRQEMKKDILFEDVAEAMKFGFMKCFQAEFVTSELTDEEKGLSEKLAKDKYSSDEWNLMK